MLQTSVLPLPTQDLSTDAEFDYYGLRLAICGVDQKIRILRLNETTGDWVQEDEWKAHDAPIAKISWAHPEHGPVLASCSFDRTVKIWEELPHQPRTAAQTSKWVERGVLVDAKGSVRSVEFAPPSFGLKLATISTDSSLRIYECLEIYSLKSWQLVEDIDVLAVAAPSPTLQAAGTPNLTPSSFEESPLGTATPRGGSATPTGLPIRPGGGNREADGGWCLSWCKEKWWGEVLAVGCGATATLKVIAFPPSPSRPVHLASLVHVVPGIQPSSSNHPYSITSVAWAPSCGRSYHLIATGSRDGYVRIWKLTPSTEVAQSEENKWPATLVGEFNHHDSSVGRVEWNITGTVLSSAGDDGKIRLWKLTSGAWRPYGSFTTFDGPGDDGNKSDDMRDD